MPQYVYINASGIHNVPLISDTTSAVPRSYIDSTLNNVNRMILPDGYVDINGGAPYDLCGNEVVRTYYQYTRSHAFIGYSNLPILDGSAVNHSQDPSHNIQGISNENFHLDVSGYCYVSHKMVVGVSGGFYIESISGGVHAIGSSEEGDMEFTSSNHVSIHVPQQQDAFYVASSGSVGISHNQPREQLDISGAIIISASKSASDASNGTIMFSDASGFLGRKNNIWVSLDNSGSGGGGGPSFDASFNYFFMDPPLASTDGSNVLVTAGGPYLHFSWQNPIQYRSAFNFVGSQPGPPDISGGSGGNDVYNALPYFKGMRIEYRTFSAAGGVTNWLEAPQNTVSGLWQGKDFLPREITNAYLAGIGGPFPDPSGSINSIYTDYSGSVIPAGHTIQIRVAMVNGAQVNITDPSYVEHGLPSLTDSSWNWLYIPTDGSGTPLGNYGPAPHPLRLTLPAGAPNLLYYQFYLEGACDNPNPSNPIADTSFNTPFSILPSINLRVQYGYDISGQRDPSSLQVGGNFGTISTSVLNPTGGITGISNTWAAVINGANPSWHYWVPRYQMRNSAVNSWMDASGQADLSLNQIFTTPNPERDEVTGTSYQQFLPSGNFTLNYGTTHQAKRGQPPQAGDVISNIRFLLPGNNVDMTSSDIFTCAANGDNNIGLDTSANEVMYFKADISNTVYDVSSAIFRGWTQDPSSVAQTINNNHIHFTTSDLSDARILLQPTSTNGLLQEEGFYLGIDISNVDVSNINLSDFPDISNNTPSYSSYFLRLYQMVRDASNSINYTTNGPKLAEFKIGEIPNFDISYNDYNTRVDLGSLLFSAQPDFFGLYNIGSTTVSSITSTDISLNSIYTTWAPTDDLNLVNLEIIFSPNGTNAQWDTNISPWQYPLTATQSLPNLGLDLPSSRFTTYPYSREHHSNPQFDVLGIYDNNIFRLSRITSPFGGGRPFPITDISFAGLPLWWDKTYGSFTPGITALKNPGEGEYPTNYTSGLVPYNSFYSNINSILFNQLMWCNEGFTCGQYTTDPSSNPYINYNGVFYIQTQDYSSFDTSGNLKNLTYTATNDDYWAGGDVSISGTYKWLMIIGQNSTSGDFAQVAVTGKVGGGGAILLTLGTHYLLYVQEIDSYFDPANNTLPAGYIAGRSGWKAVQGTWDQGATVQLNNANEAGCYRRRTNLGQLAVHHIKLYSPNSNVPLFFRIGLKNGDNVKILGVTISYGTT